MQVSAPAKINLFLKVLGIRRDGFHEIETFISPISLCDQIKIDKNKRGQGISFRCDDPSVPRDSENLAVRAANAFFAATQTKPAVSIVLKKIIPHGAGLGGGSSDAATVLLALNQLFATKLSRQKLAKLGSTIGSDVPFFIFESAAVCTGRGEIVTPRKLTQQLSILLAQLKMWLLKQPEVGAALMSGSGSTIFAVLRPNADVDLVAQRAKAQIDPELWTCVCETL